MLTLRNVAVATTAIATTLITAAGPAQAIGQARAGHARLSAGQQIESDLRNAWQLTTGRGVTVAILADGVDPTVSDLAGKVTTGPDYVPRSVSGTGEQRDAGTTLASGIAGTGPTNATPFDSIGRAPGARILSLRVAPDGLSGKAWRSLTGNGTWQGRLADAIRYAAGHGALVIVVGNNYWKADPSIDSAVSYAVSKSAVIVTTDSGFGTDGGFPADSPGVINVGFKAFPGITGLGGLPPGARHFRFTPAGSAVITAPGNPLNVVGPGDSSWQIYNDWSALAWVSGTAALIKALYPHLAPALVERAIAMSARGGPVHGYDRKNGFGILNPVGALRGAAVLAAHPAHGPVGLSAGTYFHGSPPGPVSAVRHALVKVIGFAALSVVGLLLLAAGIGMLARGRRRPGSPPAPGSLDPDVPGAEAAVA